MEATLLLISYYIYIQHNTIEMQLAEYVYGSLKMHVITLTHF